MNPPKYTAIEYINFLIGTQKAYSCSEAGRVQPEQPDPPAHDAITRLLHRLEPSSDELWSEARQLVKLTGGILVVDDSVLDKLYAQNYLDTKLAKGAYLQFGCWLLKLGYLHLLILFRSFLSLSLGG